MFQWIQTDKTEQRSLLLLAVIVVMLCSLSAYFISDFANRTQMVLLPDHENMSFYRIFFQVNNITSFLIPIGICTFFCSTIKIMLTDFFEVEIKLSQLFSIVGISMIPILLDDYFFWTNLICYVPNATILSVEDFMEIEYLGGLKINDFQYINSACWIISYIIMIINLIRKKIPYVVVFVSTMTPIFFVFITLKILSFFY